MRSAVSSKLIAVFLRFQALNYRKRYENKQSGTDCNEIVSLQLFVYFCERDDNRDLFYKALPCWLFGMW